MKTISYPVVCFFKSGIVEYARYSDDLLLTNTYLLKKRIFDDLIVIDSDGSKFIIKDATKIGTNGWFWGLTLFMYQNIRIKLNFEDFNDSLTTEEFKKEIVVWHKKHGRIIGDYLSKKDIKFIGNAKSIQEIIKYGCEWFFKEFPV